MAARRMLIARRHLGLRAADLTVLAYPKSGSTWLRFMLVQALTQSETSYDEMRKTSLPIGQQSAAPGVLPDGGRLLKSHESPRTMRSRRPRVLYLVRDGRDVAVSYFFHRQRQGIAPATFTDHLEQFLSGTIDFYGPWQEHTMYGAELMRRRRGEVFMLRYEELLANPQDMLAQVFDFFGWPLDRSALHAAVVDNRAASMRAKESMSTRLKQTSLEPIPFVRSATAGRWREHFSPADSEQFNSVAGPALRFLGYE